MCCVVSIQQSHTVQQTQSVNRIDDTAEDTAVKTERSADQRGVAGQRSAAKSARRNGQVDSNEVRDLFVGWLLNVPASC